MTTTTKPPHPPTHNPPPRHLIRQRDVMGPVAHRGITELGVLAGKGPLVMLQPHTPTLLAFEQLAVAGERASGLFPVLLWGARWGVLWE
jgi:hypothetical protein